MMRVTSPIRLPVRLAALVAAMLLVASTAVACSGGSGGGGIEVSDAWARTSPMVAKAGAAYMVIENTGSEADVLIGAASPVAATVEVHETYMVEASPSGGMGMESPSGGMGMESPSAGGMMGMRPIPKLDIPAGQSVELKPGSYHIMLINLTQELKVGEEIEITLTFEKAGEIKVTAEVREG